MANEYERALELEQLALVSRNRAAAAAKAASNRFIVAHNSWLRYRRASEALRPTEGQEDPARAGPICTPLQPRRRLATL